MKPGRRYAILCWLLPLMLAACSPSDDAEISSSQKYYFLESLKQVEAGGRQLQSSDLSELELNMALETLDQGLRLAFQVEREFLDQLDLRLGKNFERYFIRGVENYRLGIEAGDASQQREGLQQLARWAKFWNLERQAIEARLNPD